VGKSWGNSHGTRPLGSRFKTRWIEQNFYWSWVRSFLNSEVLEGMFTDHGQVSNGGLSNVDLSRTLIAQEILLLLLQLSWSDWFAAKETLRLAEGDQVERWSSNRFIWRKGRLVKDFCNFFVRKSSRYENFRTALLTLFNLWIWGVIDLLHYDAIILKVGVMHMLMKTQCTRSCGMVLMMHVSMTRLPTKWVNDWEGNQWVEKDYAWRVAFSQPRYLARP
jgi:hypothetical protein